MEHILHKSTYPELNSRLPRPQLSPFVISMMVVVSFTAVILGARTLGQFGTQPPNPFPDYADILPGQPASALETRAFLCWNNDNYYHSHPENYDPAEESCFFTPPESVFSSIEVIRMRGIIRQTTFIVHENTLLVGDVEKLLEMPMLHRLHRTAYFFLPEYFVIANTAGDTRHFSLFLPVWSITFTDIKLIT